MERCITEKRLRQYAAALREQEKSAVTVTKYCRDVERFARYAGERHVTKKLTVEWKNSLIEAGYKPASVNSMLASVNSFVRFCGWGDCRVKGLRTQRRAFQPSGRELTQEEYERLLGAAAKKPRLHLLLQAVCATGIRISELAYFTVEAVKTGEISVTCKGKTRTILLPGKLKKKLLRYAQETGLTEGPIFRTRHGRALDRSNIWKEMKALCAEAGVERTKVFPHNLRKLFARVFYKAKRDIAKLADVLGHSSVNTTRIYIMSTGVEHRRVIDRLGLVT